MDHIFHEKQEGCLCAQHCLNALLQEPYFTAVDLATLAQQMDEQERERMAENGVDSEEYRNFIKQPSGNMDDSGYFSVQVIAAALDVWNLELVLYNSTEPRAATAQKAPQEMQAYICNYHDHWFTIRKLGRQWFNLNSMLTGPQLISDTYLSVYLAQLQHEGYSIFVVFGTLPPCKAHDALLEQPAIQVSQPQRVKIGKSQGQGSSNDDPDLERALLLSLGEGADSKPNLSETARNDFDDEDGDFQRALQESVKDAAAVGIAHPSMPILTAVRNLGSDDDDDDDDDDLQRALRMSLQQEDNSSSNDMKRASGSSRNESSAASAGAADPAEIRARRLRYLEKESSKNANKNT